jgi:hypothetical protein
MKEEGAGMKLKNRQVMKTCRFFEKERNAIS